MKLLPVDVGKKKRFALLMVLLCGLLWLALLMLLDRKFFDAELTQLVTRAEQRLSVYQNSLHNSIDKYEYLPAVLANDPRIIQQLIEPKQNSEVSTLLAAVRERTGADEIFLMDHSGETRATANYLSENSFLGHNYGFRPYFQSAIDGGKGFYFAIGATSGQAGLFLAEPVYFQAEIIGVMVVKIALDDLENIWAHSGEKVWITDKLGIIFLSYDSQWLYHSVRPLSPQSRDLLTQTKQYSDAAISLLRHSETIADYNSVTLGNNDDHIVFQQDLEPDGWKVNWLFSEVELRNAVNLKKLYVSTSYFFLIFALLWLRERIRRNRSEKHIHELTQLNEARQRALIDSTDAGLINMDAAGNIIFINAQARQLFRLDYTALPDITALISPWRGIQATTQAMDATGVRNDGTHFPMLVSTSAVGFSENEEYLVTVHDVSELKQAQLELMRSNEDLEHRVTARTEALKSAERELNQSQRLASLGRMSSAIAHELNQPITALGSYAASSKLLLARNAHDKVGDNLDKISGLVERLSYISRQLRMVSGKRNTGLSDIRILPVLLYAQDVLLQKSTEAEVDLKIDIAGDDHAVGNSMMLEQVLVNLLSNAIDATAQQPERCVTVRSHARPDCYELTIHDTGGGLNADEISHIFEPFYTTKEDGDGLGLGLAISYNLVSDMDGKLSVSSSPELGTTFTISLQSSEEYR